MSEVSTHLESVITGEFSSITVGPDPTFGHVVITEKKFGPFDSDGPSTIKLDPEEFVQFIRAVKKAIAEVKEASK